MNLQTQSAANWKSGAWSATLSVALGLVFLPHPLGQGLADWSYDLPFRVRPRLEVNEVMILYMDDASHKVLNEPSNYAAWNRSVHAKLLTRLSECHARAVVFDILFDEPSANDTPLLDAIKAATNAGTAVVVGGKIETYGRQGKSPNQLLPPFETLQQVAAWGLAEHGDEDQILRSHYGGTREFAGYEWIPSLAWQVAERILSKPPAEPNARRWINYYGVPGTIRSRSVYEALDSRLLPAAALSNQVCFVGALPPQTPFSGSVSSDLWRTPYSRWSSGKAAGVEINATVYANLVRHDWLRRLSWPAESLVVIVAGVLFGFGLALTSPTRAVAIGLIGLLSVAGLACWLMWQWEIWFSWLIVAGVQIPAAIGLAVLANSRRLDREKSLLEAQLAEAATALQHAAAGPGSEGATEVTTAAAGAARNQLALAAEAGQPPFVPDHTLIRCVGKGAYGEVWLARNVIGTYHAVKVVKRVDFESDEPYEREFRGIRKFMPISRSHPGLVQILHAGRNDAAGHIYYIMEAADDESTGPKINPDTYTARNLAKDIKKRRHLPAEECLQLSLDLTAALDFLHRQQLIHRDIKPSNIIFVQGAPKFADIGLVTDIATRGHEATYLGTKGYIAPEGPGTPAADIYSLGKVIYEASMGLECGQFPELPSTLLQRSDAADLFRLNEIILKACHVDPALRYQSAAEMHEDLERLQKRQNA